MAHQHQSSASGSGDFVTVRKHDEFYLSGGDLHFLIENNLFRVHRYFFERESPYFRNKLTTPASPGASRQGTTDSNAIVLDDVRSADFAKLLWVFYNPKYSLYHADAEDWTAILDLAHRWGFSEVKNLCVREMEKLEISDIDRIVVYHKYDVDKTLLIPRYAALCMREETLTLPEGLRLGMETTLMIARARECARSKDSGSRSPTPADLDAESMHALIKDIFGIASVASVPAPEAATASSSTAQTETPKADGLTDLAALQETQVEVAQQEQELTAQEPTASQPQPQPPLQLQLESNPQELEPMESEPQQKELTEPAVEPAAEQTSTPTPTVPPVPVELPQPQEPLPPLLPQPELTSKREEIIEEVIATTDGSDQRKIDGGEGVNESGGDVEDCLGVGSGNGYEGEKEGEVLAPEATAAVVELVADDESVDQTVELHVAGKEQNLVAGKEVEVNAGGVGGEADGQAEVPDQTVETTIGTSVVNKDTTSETESASNVEVQGERTVDADQDQGTTEDSEGNTSGTTLIEENAEQTIDNIAEDGKVEVEFQVPGDNTAGELGEPPGDTVKLTEITKPSGGELTTKPEPGRLEESFTWDFEDTAQPSASSNDNPAPQAGADDIILGSSQTQQTEDSTDVTLQASADPDPNTRQSEGEVTTSDDNKSPTSDLLDIELTSNVGTNNGQIEEGQTAGSTDSVDVENASKAAPIKADDHDSYESSQVLGAQGANVNDIQNPTTVDLVDIEIPSLTADDDESDDPNEHFYDSPDWPDFPLDSIPNVLKLSFE